MQTHGIFNDSALRFIFSLIDVQETMQELALAKEKCTSAWNEASKSIFLLDEQSQKIEELCDQMKELKANHSTSLLPTPVPVIAPSNAIASTESTGAISSAIVRLFVFVSFL